MQPKRTQWKRPMMMHETQMTSQSGFSHVWGQQQQVQHQLVAAYSDFEPPASFVDVAAPSLAATAVPCCSSPHRHCHRYPLLLDSCYVSMMLGTVPNVMSGMVVQRNASASAMLVCCLQKIQNPKSLTTPHRSKSKGYLTIDWQTISCKLYRNPIETRILNPPISTVHFHHGTATFVSQRFNLRSSLSNIGRGS